MPINATPGDSAANSYMDTNEADTYFSERLHSSAWDGLNSEDKESLLIWSTRVIESRIAAYFDKKELPNDATIYVLEGKKTGPDSYVCWTGEPASEDQALSWPRKNMKNKNGFDLPDDVIPEQLKHFQAEVALKLAGEDRTVENAAAAQGLSGLTAGPVKLSWRDTAPNPKLIPDSIMQFLVPSWWFAFELKYRRQAGVTVL